MTDVKKILKLIFYINLIKQQISTNNESLNKTNEFTTISSINIHFNDISENEITIQQETEILDSTHKTTLDENLLMPIIEENSLYPIESLNIHYDELQNTFSSADENSQSTTDTTIQQETEILDSTHKTTLDENLLMPIIEENSLYPIESLNKHYDELQNNFSSADENLQATTDTTIQQETEILDSTHK
ncbi:hypothetical protein BpHYR1_002754, partial [Brachionus plicatilis]